MGKFNESSESTKKLFNIILCVAAILVIFAAVVGLWILVGKSSPDSAAVANGTGLPMKGVPASYVTGLPNKTVTDGNTYLSMISAARIVMSNDTGKSWAQEHPDCQLYQADASLLDIGGLSYQWSLIFRSTGTVLLAEVMDGNVTVLQSQNMEGLQVPPADARQIYDSNSIMGIAAENLSLTTAPGNMLFSMKYVATDNGVYDIVYNDPAQPMPVTISIDATTGQVIADAGESTSGGSAP